MCRCVKLTGSSQIVCLKSFYVRKTPLTSALGFNPQTSGLIHPMCQSLPVLRHQPKTSKLFRLLWHIWVVSRRHTAWPVVLSPKAFFCIFQVDGVFVDLPFYHKDKLKAYISGVHGFIHTDFDLKVSFDWYSYARVIVPSMYANATCGLCGNNNEDTADDMTMKNGTLTSDEIQFADSWKVGEVPGCHAGCLNDCPKCSEEMKKTYRGDKYCGVIIKKNGPFHFCHKVIDPASYFDDCVFDTCQYKAHHDTLCSTISTYVTACQAQGIRIGKWRSAAFCSK